MHRSEEKRYEAKLQRRSVAAGFPRHSVHVNLQTTAGSSPLWVIAALQGLPSIHFKVLTVPAAHQVNNIDMPSFP
jgi:hypothetical protein